MSPAASAERRQVWSIPFEGRLVRNDLDLLEERTNISLPWYFAPGEYVVGYRFLPSSETATTYVRAVRESGSELVFELITTESPSNDKQWSMVRDDLSLALEEIGIRSRRRPERGASEDVVLAMSQLLDARTHIGYSRRHWNPRMSGYILADRGGQKIIDLRQTLHLVNEAYEFIRQTAANGGTVLMVGTRKQTRQGLETVAERVQMPYVTNRWLGGMLTNFATMRPRIERLHVLRALQRNGWPTGRTKKENVLLERELMKLEKNLGGLANLRQPPDAIWILDPSKEHLAVHEANRLNIPVVALADTDANPDLIDFVIPGNATGLESRLLLSSVIGDAVAQGLLHSDMPSRELHGPFRMEEPPASWEIEMLADVDMLDSLRTTPGIKASSGVVDRPHDSVLRTSRTEFEGKRPELSVEESLLQRMAQIEHQRSSGQALENQVELLNNLIDLTTALWGAGYAEDALVSLDEARAVADRLRRRRIDIARQGAWLEAMSELMDPGSEIEEQHGSATATEVEGE